MIKRNSEATMDMTVPWGCSSHIGERWVYAFNSSGRQSPIHSSKCIKDRRDRRSLLTCSLFYLPSFQGQHIFQVGPVFFSQLPYKIPKEIRCINSRGHIVNVHVCRSISVLKTNLMFFESSDRFLIMVVLVLSPSTLPCWKDSYKNQQGSREPFITLFKATL